MDIKILFTALIKLLIPLNNGVNIYLNFTKYFQHCHLNVSSNFINLIFIQIRILTKKGLLTNIS